MFRIACTCLLVLIALVQSNSANVSNDRGRLRDNDLATTTPAGTSHDDDEILSDVPDETTGLVLKETLCFGVSALVSAIIVAIVFKYRDRQRLAYAVYCDDDDDDEPREHVELAQRDSDDGDESSSVEDSDTAGFTPELAIRLEESDEEEQ
jgi:hypothetical protein